MLFQSFRYENNQKKPNKILFFISQKTQSFAVLLTAIMQINAKRTEAAMS